MPPNNLPQRLTSFIGRNSEIAEIGQLLRERRLLTLTGAGGSGKTRLALEAASCVLDEYPDGVWFVELAALSDPALPPQAIAALLGVREEPGRPLLDVLATYLQPADMLLILDNCEHLVESCALLAEKLLLACPHLRILATSRQPLGLEQETAHRVPPLTMPDPQALPTAEMPAEYEAVKLFIERAQSARPDFALTAENAPAVVQLCSQLDGIPLAIELAAARVKVLSVEQIAERLDERFRLLASTSRTVQPRHRSLQAMMDWSYDLLSSAERLVLQGLSVFAGSFTLDAVRSVCNLEVDEYETIDLLSQLVDRSLLMVDDVGGVARYRLLETIRHYAGERLEDAGEAPLLRSRHLEYYTLLAEHTEDELLSSKQALSLERLELEHDNLRAALAWGSNSQAEQSGSYGLRLAGSLVWYWYFRGYLSEGRSWLEAALAISNPAEVSVPRAKALSAVGALAYLQSDLAVARAWLQESLLIWEALDEKRGLAFALTFLGRVADRQGDPLGGVYGERSVELFREIGDRWGLALSLDFLGEVARDRGDNDLAAALHDESLGLYTEMGHNWGVALELSHFGRVALQQGDHTTARQQLEEAVQIQRSVGDKWMLAWTLHNLGDVARRQEEPERASLLYDESRALFSELGDKSGPDGTLPAGELLPKQAAIAEENGPDGLTRREAEVLSLVAEGLTDAQIADRLSLSARTVQAHVRSIYSKLNITTRSAATRYAMEHDLV